MYLDDTILNKQERVVIELRGIYERHGYLSFKMSKFEEYDLYSKNKDFLVSDRVITFNDTDGKLLALKPDVTLSIIKNAPTDEGYKNKVYYNENVYRVSQKTSQFKEIMQTGLECIGDIDITDIFEVLYLATESLRATGADYVINLSHMGIVTALVDKFGAEFKSSALALLAQKNAHELNALCDEHSVPEKDRQSLLTIIDMYGAPSEFIDKFMMLSDAPEYLASCDQLSRLSALIKKSDFADRIKLDFSVVNDVNYYNGIVFRGYVAGVPDVVLLGGEYARLIKRMGKRGGACGFALYTDLLSELYDEGDSFDVDTLILYDDKTSPDEVIAAKARLLAENKSFTAQKTVSKRIRCREILNLSEDKQ